MYGSEEAYGPADQMEAATIEDLGRRLEKNAVERQKLLDQVRMIAEQAEKTKEVASHLLDNHSVPLNGRRA